MHRKITLSDMKHYLTSSSFLTLLAIVSVMSISSCGNTGENSQKGETNRISQPQETMSSEKPVQETIAPGKEVYDKICLACHQADGSGVPGMFPPVAGSEYIAGDAEDLVKLIVEGLSGPVEVKGEKYNGIMPPRNDLTDKQIADLLTWLRSNFGNSGGAVSAQDVAAIRKK
jgi:mono/diheme cytochrome c family protein